MSRRQEQGGKLSLTASLVEENQDVGVFVTGAEATVVATAVRATQRAPAGLEIGDGILVVDALGQSRATIAETESTDNARAGVMYVSTTGEPQDRIASGDLPVPDTATPLP